MSDERLGQSKPTIEVRGRRFSRRTVEVHAIDEDESNSTQIDLTHINWNDHLTDVTLQRYLQKAMEIVRKAGIDADSMLDEQSPYGSLLRKHILNQYEPDSDQALAAQIIEIILHMQASDDYRQSLAFLLGRLTQLLDVYLGDPFKPRGRGPGPIKRKVKSLLKKNPDMSTTDLWRAVIDEPPKGWMVINPRMGDDEIYLSGPENVECHLPRFRNIVSEVRREIK
jgi:hypothetical protein